MIGKNIHIGMTISQTLSHVGDNNIGPGYLKENGKVLWSITDQSSVQIAS